MGLVACHGGAGGRVQGAHNEVLSGRATGVTLPPNHPLLVWAVEYAEPDHDSPAQVHSSWNALQESATTFRREGGCHGAWQEE